MVVSSSSRILRQRPQQEVFGKSIVKIVGDEPRSANNSLGTKMGFTCLGIISPIWTHMGNQVDDRSAIMRDRHHLAPLDIAGKLLKTILKFLNGHSFHGSNLNLSEHLVNITRKARHFWRASLKSTSG
jgi:hypothetical protein